MTWLILPVDNIDFLDLFTGTVAFVVVLILVLPRRWIKKIRRIAFPWL